jgi:ATP-dependent protease HslVU (ClpYQ), ATPase subunit
MNEFSPREIVSELDRFIIGQADAKRAVASRCATAGVGCSSTRGCAKR